MILGLAITPPILGRITIGKVVERNGKRLPEKDDQFTITSQMQGNDGWIPHHFDNALRKAVGENGKIRRIPIRLMFNEPDLNLRSEYSKFDRSTGRPMCVGNGETCKRFVGASEGGIKTFPCPSPDGCELAKGNACKPYGRLNVTIGDEDPLGSFIFRTTGFNSIRTLAARLEYFKAVSGNRLACMPLELRLRGKSTTNTYRSAIYYVDITVRDGMTLEDALIEAKQTDEARKVSGFDQAALDQAARLGFANGAFEDGTEDGAEIVEEFFPDGAVSAGVGLGVNQSSSNDTPATVGKVTLSDKLSAKAVALDGGAP